METPQPANQNDPWYKKDRIARAAIGLMIEDGLLIDVKDCRTAKQMLQNLKTTFENNSFGTQIFLMRKLFNTKYSPGSSMLDHLNSLKETVSKLNDMGETMSEKLITAAMLGSLPPNYGNLITAIEGRPNKDITLSFVKSQILEEAKRRNDFPSAAETHQNKTLFTQSPRAEYNRYSPKCFHCGKVGHIRRNCRKLTDHNFHQGIRTKEESDNQNKSQEFKTNITSDYNEQSEAITLLCSHNNRPDEWIVDSGATKHIVNNKSSFIKLNLENNAKTVKTANGSYEPVLGRGEAEWKFKDSEGIQTRVILQNALYIPSIVNNLVSVRELSLRGVKVRFTKDGIQLDNGEAKIKLSPDNGGLIDKSVTRESNQCVHQWHTTLGHCNLKKIKEMSKKGVTKDLKIKQCEHSDFCEACATSKSTVKSFPKTTLFKAKRTFDLLHIDLCGPIHPVSLGGNSYILTISDDLSRYVKIQPIKVKAAAASHIMKFIEHGKNRFNRYPSYIRTDNGGEFLGQEFEDFLDHRGIHHQKTVAYSPSQNGVAERLNRTIIESVRCLLKNANLRKSLWGEAADCAGYIHNRLDRSHTGVTPFEQWYGYKPSLKHLKSFGQKCFYHVPHQNRKKLDDTSRFGIFVGYSDDSKSYRVLDWERRVVIASRSVIFTGQYLKYKLDEPELIVETTLPDPKPEDSLYTLHNHQDEIAEDDEVQEDVPPREPAVDNIRRSSRANFGVPPQRLIAGEV